ncbi:porin [Caldimonas tepidiphila]|uniref:porin n=1 Tax=Caldimonas tepidiphila TaxID=2315841 RepID=UPI000E5AF168|nr:porin [Caldimonas tepidiphila]
MKRTTIALAAFAAFAATATAQPSVTIYGKIDMGVQKSNGGTAALAGATTGGGPNAAFDEPHLTQGASSRLGFRGTEDLGGGLSANFNLEHRFLPNDGTLQAANFWQQSWVSLAGGFGELRLGRDFSPAFSIAASSDPFGYETVGQAGPLHTLMGIITSRWNNNLSYRTRSFAGLSGAVAIAPRGTAGQEHAVGANLRYQQGRLALGFGYDNSGHQTAAALGATETRSYLLSAIHDFGVVRPMFLYGKGTAYNAAGAEVQSRSNVQIGATAPLGGGDVKFVLAQRDNDTNDTRIRKLGLGYHYSLSKRTKAYADIGSASETRQTRRTALDLGLQHNF